MYLVKMTALRGVVALLLLALAPAVPAEQTIGLFLNEAGSYDGYTLFAPLSWELTYLVDNDGREIHSWPSLFPPQMSAYLLDDGAILRATAPPSGPGNRFTGPGGRLERIAWDGTLVWEFVYSTADYRQHHDFEPLPDGNVLLIAWELKTDAEAIAAGRDPTMISEGAVWPLHIVEVEPVGATGGTIVWEWHLWDHLIQDFDMTKDNFGVVADHPELVDINYGGSAADWIHGNSIDYNAALDQILVSTRTFGEIWIIDHSTTTAEAAGHTGGNSGMGGDLLYRWGNPEAYDRGIEDDRVLYGQHDAQWVEPGLPGAGNITVFNNDAGVPSGSSFSSVVEIAPPVDGSNYTLDAGQPYGPATPVWTFTTIPPADMYSSIMCGTHRLPNGNTFITLSPQGNLLEVNALGTFVWKYVNPVGSFGPLEQGESGTSIWRAHRYAPDHPGFVGKDLTPGDPIELFDAPPPAPDGSSVTQPMTASPVAVDRISVNWDVGSCTAFDYNLIYGNLADVASYTLQGGECAIGASGSYDWTGVPAGGLYFVVVGVDDTGCYESSWGTDSAGQERNGTSASFECSATNKDDSQTCP